MNDFRYGLRLLAKNPGFTAVAALSLALGIGANTTVFCWIQATLLRPFPGVADQERLVVLCATHREATYDTASLPDLKDFRALTNVFAGIIGSQITPACLTINGHQEWAYGQITTANFFDVLGVKAQWGRTFVAEEDLRPGGAPVLVLSHGFWQRRFGADPGVLGRTVELNRRTFTIVGVAPPGFRGSMNPLSFDFWAPLSMHQEVANFGSLTSRGDHWLHAIGRLQPGVRRVQAQAAVTLKARQLEQAYPASNRDIGLKVLPVWKSPWGAQSIMLPVLCLLMAVSLAVLLIVAANVANLLLARATARQKEIAIRLALGAQRGRLVRQLLTESALLAVLGGALGVVLAHWAIRTVLLFIPNTHLPIHLAFGLDGGTLAFTCGLAAVSTFLFGLAPALQTTRAQLHATLKEGSRTSATGGSRHTLRTVLVVAEITLALALLVCAGLCIKGSQRARAVDPGFNPTNALVAGLRIGMHGYTETTGKVFYRQLRERLVDLPGVEEAALASWFPLGFEGGSSTTIQVDGYQPAPNEDTTIQYSIVTPRYFAAMRIPLLAGRDFTERDDLSAPRVVVINETMARRFWPGLDPVGRKLRVHDQEATVVGVVRAGKYRTLSEPPKSFFHLPYQQGVWDLNLGVVLRTRENPSAFLATLPREIHAVDPGVEVWARLTMLDYIEAAFVGQRMASTLLTILGGVALLLATLGIYGVMAYQVSQRTQEFGVRLALGAQSGDVLRLVLGHGARLALIGVGLGLVVGIIAALGLSSFLYGVSPFDPLTFATVAAGLTLVCLVASYVPARRATRVDPLVTLRCE